MKLTHDLPPPVPNAPFVVDVEIQAVTRHFPGQSVAGFQWRYRLALIRTRTSDPAERYTEWVFCSREKLQSIAQTWQLYLLHSEAGTPGQAQ